MLLISKYEHKIKWKCCAIIQADNGAIFVCGKLFSRKEAIKNHLIKEHTKRVF